MEGKVARVGKIHMTHEKLKTGSSQRGDENKTEQRDRWWEKELLSLWRSFSGRSQPCRDGGQSMPGRGNSAARPQGSTALAWLRKKPFQCGQSTGAQRRGVGELTRAMRSLWKVKSYALHV